MGQAIPLCFRVKAVKIKRTLVILSNDIGILSEDSEKSLRRSIEDVSAQLNALHRGQHARID
jgi:hypothetical protein